MTAAPDREATLRRMAWAAAVAGLGTLALTTAFLRLPEARAATEACGGRTPSLIQFQLALSLSDVEEALGPAGPCRDAAIIAMDSVNRLDVRAYIVTYGAFVLLSLFVVMREARLPRLWPVALVVGAALVADAVETTTQLAITGAMSAGTGSAQRYMPLLVVAARAKFLGLGLAAVAASWAGWKARPRRPLLAASCLPIIVLLPLTLVSPKSFGDLAPLGTAVAWLALLGTVAHIAVRGPRERTTRHPGKHARVSRR